MFVLMKGSSYTWPVTFRDPVSGGKYETRSFSVVFKRLEQTKMMGLMQELTDEKLTTLDLCRQVVVGWNDVSDAQGALIPFSAENLEELLDYPGIANAILEAYSSSIRGAAEKN